MEVVSILAGDSWQCVKRKQSLCDARCAHKNRAVPKYKIRNKNTEDRCSAGGHNVDLHKQYRIYTSVTGSSRKYNRIKYNTKTQEKGNVSEGLTIQGYS